MSLSSLLSTSSSSSSSNTIATNALIAAGAAAAAAAAADDDGHILHRLQPLALLDDSIYISRGDAVTRRVEDAVSDT